MTRCLSLALLLFFTAQASAHEAGAQIDVPQAARRAAAVVDQFFSALSTSDLEEAGALLDPQVHVHRLPRVKKTGETH